MICLGVLFFRFIVLGSAEFLGSVGLYRFCQIWRAELILQTLSVFSFLSLLWGLQLQVFRMPEVVAQLSDASFIFFPGLFIFLFVVVLDSSYCRFFRFIKLLSFASSVATFARYTFYLRHHSFHLCNSVFSYSFLNIWNMVIVAILMSFSANSVICIYIFKFLYFERE